MFYKIQLDRQYKRISIRSVCWITKYLNILMVLENTEKDNAYIIKYLLDLRFLPLHL